MNNYDNKIGQNQDCPRKKTLDVLIPKPFPINQPRLSTPSAMSGTGVGSMQEVVRGSLFLDLTELPTEFQKAHLKKSTSALSKCLDKGVAGILKGGSAWLGAIEEVFQRRKHLEWVSEVQWVRPGRGQLRHELLWPFPSANMFWSVTYALHMQVDVWAVHGQRTGKWSRPRKPEPTNQGRCGNARRVRPGQLPGSTLFFFKVEFHSRDLDLGSLMLFMRVFQK